MSETQSLNEKIYEINFLLDQENDSVLKGIFSKHGLRILSEKPLQKIRLAYQVKKKNDAFLGSLQFALTPLNLEAMESDLRLQKDLLRYMISNVIIRDVKGGMRSQNFSKEKFYPKEGKDVKKTYKPALTNEALEKKIEEILK